MPPFTAVPRSLCWILLCCLAGCQSLPPVDPDPAARAEAGRALFLAAADADAAGETEAALLAIREAAALRPNHPTLLYNAAALEAQAGYTASARLRLERLAAMGVGFDVRAQPAFDGLAGRDDFERVADQLASQALPRGESELVLRWVDIWDGERQHLPEGLAFDPASETWYLTTVASGQLLAFDAKTVEQPSRGFLMLAGDGRGFFGSAWDADRGCLWVTASLPPGQDAKEDSIGIMRDQVPLGRSVLFRLVPEELAEHPLHTDLPRLITENVQLAPVPGEQPAALGDVLVRADGEVLVSDAEGGTVWRVRQPDGGEAGEALRLARWLQGASLPSPQGLAEARDAVYLADYSTGLHRLNDDGERQPLIKPEDLCDLGIDGLAATPDGRALVAIQNGFAPQRILWLPLSEDGATITGWQVLAAGLPEWREPTLGLIHDGWFYFVANSHWPDFAADFHQPTAELTPPEIRRVQLPR